MAASTSYPHVTVEVGEEYCLSNSYPYPLNLCATGFTSVKLSGKNNYIVWKTQMQCLLVSHDMFGFVNGKFVSPEGNRNGKAKVGDQEAWARSDALVKSWILGSLTEQAAMYFVSRLNSKFINADFTAKDLWDDLDNVYAPAVIPQQPGAEGGRIIEGEAKAQYHRELYEATLEGNWRKIDHILRTSEVTIMDKITNNGNMALHVAVSTNQSREFLEKLLEQTRKDTLLDARNSDGSTLLHVAAIVGNTDAANILVGINRKMLLAKDNEGHIPLAIALSNMHTRTSQCLLDHIKADVEMKTLFSGPSGDELLVNVISCKDFGLAKDLAGRYKTVHSDAVLMAIAQNFPRESYKWVTDIEMLRSRVANIFDSASHCMANRCFCRPSMEAILGLLLVGMVWILIVFRAILNMLVPRFVKKEFEVHKDALELLRLVCIKIKYHCGSSSHHHYYTHPILEAIRQNAYEVVEEIVSCFPDAIWIANEDGHNIFQYAVINRSEKVYNLLYQMSEHRNIYKTIKDSSGNNLLHLVARLAPANKLNLISGAALQIQRELQWFKEIERFVCPLNVIQKNSFNETPRMVFTKEHKDLVIEGEKWMKATAESYTITAALITTVVFAAAITVPGGNNQESGIPVFTNKMAFTIFAISDAISLFTSVTSLLIFLSILTARFAEQDFLFKLPTKLIIGLATLFISTTAMIVAFGATLYLVFGQSESQILIAIAALTCLPITSFVTLQFPLVLDLMSVTYGRSIFGKKRKRNFY